MGTTWHLICKEAGVKIYVGKQSEQVDCSRLIDFIEAADGKPIEAVNEHDAQDNDHDEQGLTSVGRLREI